MNMELQAPRGRISWEEEPVTRGEYSRDLADIRGAIARLQFFVGGCVALGTIVTSLVSVLHR